MVYEDQFTLKVRSPFRLDLTVWTLRRRQKNLIDRWNGKEYTRVLVIDKSVLLISVRQRSQSELSVSVKSTGQIVGKVDSILDLLAKILGTTMDLEDFYNLAGKDRYLSPLVATFQGMKPPRFPTIFEALVNAIACQQVTLDLGILLLNRFAEKFGKELAGQYAFPQPEDLIHATEEEIKSMGFSYQKARTILTVARILATKAILPDVLEDMTNEEVMNTLTAIKGIGRWSGECALLRGLGRVDTLPGDDVGAQKNLVNLMHLDKKPSYDEIKVLTKPWEPYSGLVYFHLLLAKLEEKNLIGRGGENYVL